jgi:hypothetical protein
VGREETLHEAGLTERLRGNAGRLRDTVLCHCAVGKPVAHALYFLADYDSHASPLSVVTLFLGGCSDNYAVNPPSIVRLAPVTKPASGPAR